ncbi:hypothetical protein RND81_12G227600 [Saponaria officinalis]|uniref:FBD domain-containing protein n=1 Tax=Saponaria officinalis TaxID=3572 RepID=A0AAW1HE42_SAPOF
MVTVKAKEIDRISPLSNALLARILSFLQIKDVVKTSILSWRWKYVWWNVPVLDLSSLNLPISAHSSFKAFVYKALVLNNAPIIQRFCLDFSDELEVFHVNSWIWSVMQRNVVEVNLSSCMNEERRLVNELFSSEKLRALKLCGKFIVPYLDPLLQHLPNLERLILCIKSSTIRSLEITSTNGGMKGIVIEAPRLECIFLSETVSCYNIKIVGYLSCLVHVTFNSNCPSKDHRCGIIDLLHHAFRLKTLKLTQSKSNQSLEYHGVQLPVFHNLERLELAYVTAPFVLQMLKHAVNLTSLTLHKLKGRCGADDSLMLPKNAPNCLLRSLKAVVIIDFCWYERHARLAEYLLRYAAVLKVLRIHIAEDDLEYKLGRLMQLFLVHKASKDCEFAIKITPED